MVHSIHMCQNYNPYIKNVFKCSHFKNENIVLSISTLSNEKASMSLVSDMQTFAWS